jgi:pilus assembly protein CpaF
VTHISEVTGLQGESVTMTDIFVFDYDAGLDIEGKYAGGLIATGLLPSLLDKLDKRGERLDARIFELEDVAVGAE